MELRSFYFHHPQLFIVPVEHLSRTGVDAEYAKVAAQERGLSEAWFELLGESVAKYFERLKPLFSKARGQWFPPRLTNLCVVTDTDGARPYYQPFVGSSLLLDVSDFDPETSNVEFATYQLVHGERLAITRNLPKTLIGNLGYFIARTEAERDAFAEAAKRCRRPDAEGFAALGEAMQWIGNVLHEQLKPPLLSRDGLTEVPGTGLLLTDEHAMQLTTLIQQFEGAARGVVQRYLSTQAQPLGGPSPAERISTFLTEHQPQLLLADANDQIIWDPAQPNDTDAIGPAVAELCDRAAVSICEDLAVVDARTKGVLARLSNADALPHHGEEVEQEGGAYLHDDRRLIVYSLHQPGVNTKQEGAPPFHQWLLGARIGHEWGHLAADADMIRIPADKQRRHDEALTELAALLDTIVDRAPQGLRDKTREHFASRPVGKSIGEAMVDMQMRRIGDYKSNVLAHALLPIEEMESYVRVNVRPLAGEQGNFLGKLARYAYEFQYLGFSRIEDPKRYFFTSTWFANNYIDTGILSREEADRLLDLMGEVCTSYVLAPDTLLPRDA